MITETITDPELEHALLPHCRMWREKVASLGESPPRCESVVDEFWEAVSVIQSQPPMSRSEYIARFGKPLWEMEAEQIDAQCNALEMELEESCAKARAFLSATSPGDKAEPVGPETLVLEALKIGRCLDLTELLGETGLDREAIYEALGNLLSARRVRTNPSGWYWLMELRSKEGDKGVKISTTFDARNRLGSEHFVHTG